MKVMCALVSQSAGGVGGAPSRRDLRGAFFNGGALYFSTTVQPVRHHASRTLLVIGTLQMRMTSIINIRKTEGIGSVFSAWRDVGAQDAVVLPLDTVTTNLKRRCLCNAGSWLPSSVLLPDLLGRPNCRHPRPNFAKPSQSGVPLCAKRRSLPQGVFCKLYCGEY